MSNTSELQFIETDAGQIYDFIMYVLENGVTEELYPRRRAPDLWGNACASRCSALLHNE